MLDQTLGSVGKKSLNYEISHFSYIEACENAQAIEVIFFHAQLTLAWNLSCS